MNETSATSASGMSLLPDGIATLTTIHFAIIAVLAILVIIGLIWGIRAKRSRVQASRDVIANAAEAGVPPEPITRAPASTPAPTSKPTPTSKPAPAPTADRGVTPSQSQAQTRTAAPIPVAPAPPPLADAPAPDFDRPAAEPIVPASPEAAPSPAPTPAPAPVETSAPAASYADAPVTQLKGLGPKVAARLAELGVTTVGQMAALGEAEAQRIDAQLGAFTGRMGRDRWIEQARLLAAGDKAGFEAVFGKL
ncbi:hypothetical protein [Sphingomonas sp. M1A8_2b]